MTSYIRTAALLLSWSCVIAVPETRAQAAAQRQVITGIVIDSTNGKPVAAASVQLLPTHLGDLSHADGRFAIAGVAPGTYSLVVDRIGYRQSKRSVIVQAGVPVQLRIELSVAAVELGAVIVTGTVSPREKQDIISSVSTVSGAELDRRAAQTIAQMLDVKPGLAMKSLGPSTAQPVIRGLSGDRILMLEDGQRPGDMSSTSGDHSIAIDPSTASHIEVVRGPMSLLYGSSALGGVVNVVREEIPASLPHELQGTLSLQSASGNRSVTGGGHVVGRLGTWAWRGEASALTAGDTRTPLGKIAGTDARTYNFSAGIGYPGELTHLGASYRMYLSDYGVPGGFVGGHPTPVEISMQRHKLRLAGEQHRDNKLISTLSYDGGYTYYHHAETEPSGALGTDYTLNLVQSQVVARHGVHGSAREGAFGVRAQYRDIGTGGTLKTPSTYDFSFAGFAIEEFGGEQLRFQVGLRYDWARYAPRDTTSFVLAGGEIVRTVPRTFGAVSGSLGALLVASEAIRVGGSVSRAYRTPDFNELYSNGPHLAANSFEVGDPHLEEETGTGVDAFFRIGTTTLIAEIAGYVNVLGNYIFPSSRGRAELGAQGGRPRFQYTNHDARFVGLEGEMDAVVHKALHLEATGSLVNAVFTSPVDPIPVFDGADTTFIPGSKYPPLIPPAQGRIGLRLEQTGYFAGSGVKLVAPQNRLGDFETRTAGYRLLDFTAGVRITKFGRLHTITLRAENLLDQEYRDHLSRIKEIMPGPGRSISLLYRLVF